MASRIPLHLPGQQMSTQEMAEYLVTGDSGGRGAARLQSVRQAVDKMSSADKKKLVATRSGNQTMFFSFSKFINILRQSFLYNFFQRREYLLNL